jgi:branched-subunit amino acid ABC-type transport system permease component
MKAPVYLIQAIHGLIYGMLLFLIACGLTLVFGMMGVLNLAHASFYMLGAYFAYVTRIDFRLIPVHFFLDTLDYADDENLLKLPEDS